MCSLMRVHRGARAARLLVAERLQKMKNCLAGFLNGDHYSGNMKRAFQEWEDDLKWLEENF